MILELLIAIIVFAFLLGWVGDGILSHVHRESTPERRKAARIVRDCAVHGYLWAGIGAVALSWIIVGKASKEAGAVAVFGMLAGLVAGLVVEQILLWMMGEPLPEEPRGPTLPARPTASRDGILGNRDGFRRS